jgi:hypothetical protein
MYQAKTLPVVERCLFAQACEDCGLRPRKWTVASDPDLIQRHLVTVTLVR